MLSAVLKFLLSCCWKFVFDTWKFVFDTFRDLIMTINFWNTLLYYALNYVDLFLAPTHLLTDQVDAAGEPNAAVSHSHSRVVLHFILLVRQFSPFLCFLLISMFDFRSLMDGHFGNKWIRVLKCKFCHLLVNFTILITHLHSFGTKCSYESHSTTFIEKRLPKNMIF